MKTITGWRVSAQLEVQKRWQIVRYRVCGESWGIGAKERVECGKGLECSITYKLLCEERLLIPQS
jgi:hypothetical protein